MADVRDRIFILIAGPKGAGKGTFRLGIFSGEMLLKRQS